ncbi:hypothetical protein I4U23_002625 [Adineta vaga]|nr:hypothetical protein I4U23_002625 [Adineta vaga]
MNMCRSILFLFLMVYVTIVETSCPLPEQYYLDCAVGRKLNDSIKLCKNYGMTLMNLTNSSHITQDIMVLNQTLRSANCYSRFWFASKNVTGILGSLDTLDDVLTGLLSGVGELLAGVLGTVGNILCLIPLFGCPATTTPAPITDAVTVCVRPKQQRVVQKCSSQAPRTDMKTYQFVEQTMFGGVLNTFPSRSRMTCSGICSTLDECIGISYINGICSIYI